ncbi:unnamed protein product, partial [Ixodes hexagonus]
RRKRFSLFKELGIPGPTPSLIYGNIREIREKGVVAALDEWISKYGDIVGFYNGATPVLVVKDLDLIKRVQIQDFSNFRDRGVASLFVRIHHLTSMSLSNSTGVRWRSMRKALQSAFTPSKLRKLGSVTDLCCDEFMNILGSREVQGKTFEVGQAFQKLSTDTTVRSLFGAQAYQKLCKDGTGIEVIKRQLEIFLESLVSGWQTIIVECFPEFSFVWRWIWVLRARFMKLPMDKIEEAMAPVVDLRRSCPKQDDHDDMLQLMLNAESEGNISVVNTDQHSSEVKNGFPALRILSDKEIQANICAALVDGFEAVGTAMTFMAYLLAKHQDVQDKLRSEIIVALEKTGEPYLDAVLRIQYLDQVTTEALRCCPPVVGFITRTCATDYDYNGLKIPSGMSVLIPVHQLHRDVNLWNEPKEFSPDRFSADNRGSLNPMQYQAFGNGPRGCLGMRFAQQELKVTFAKILLNYKLLLDERHLKEKELKLKTSFIFAYPRDGVWIRLEKVSGQS